MTTISNISGATGPTGTAATPQLSAADKATMEKTAKAFEAIFLRQMIGSMRTASLAEGLTDSSASDQFRDMADSRTADSMSETGSFGIAQLLMRQLGPKMVTMPSTAAAAPMTATPLKDDAQ